MKLKEKDGYKCGKCGRVTDYSYRLDYGFRTLWVCSDCKTRYERV